MKSEDLAPYKFRAIIRKQGPNPYVDTPQRISAAFAPFGRGGRIRVQGWLNDTAIRGTLVPAGRGRHRLFLHGGMRSAAGVRVGDSVRLELRPTKPDSLKLPRDVASALVREPGAKQRFEQLSISHRRELLRFIDIATPQRRSRHIGEMIDHLLGREASPPRLHPERPLWTCPKCGNEFVNRNQWHSCKRFSLADSFTGKPRKIRDLFDRFREMVEACGPVKMVAYRDKVAFMVRVRFAGVVPKPRWMDVVFWLRRRLEHPRLHKVETLLPNAHVHVLRVTERRQLDRQLAGWIAEAYSIGSQQG